MVYRPGEYTEDGSGINTKNGSIYTPETYADLNGRLWRTNSLVIMQDNLIGVNNIYYSIYLEPGPNDDESQSHLFGKILSTFQFIEPKTTPTNGYICPPSGYVNCMPILNDAGKKGCSTEAIAWYKTHCPNFKGIAQ